MGIYIWQMQTTVIIGKKEFQEFLIFFWLHTFSYISTLKNYLSTNHFCEEKAKIKIAKTVKEEAAHVNHVTKWMAHSYAACRHSHKQTPEDCDFIWC